jgi:catechol 2,3-dioxygenase-like lactoylglutathione lyase family enzyme
LFEIKKLFHLTQVVESLDQADDWYNRVFSPCRFYRGYMKEAFRNASLLAIGDSAVIEPVQVSQDAGAEQSPLGRFKARFGARLHSVAWYVDDLEAAVDWLRSHSVRLVDVAGRPIENREDSAKVKYVWTHPRDSHGALEFARLNPAHSIDPRVQAHWSSAFWRSHPLGLTGPLVIAMSVRDPKAAAAFYENVLRARPTSSQGPNGGNAFAVGSDTWVELLDSSRPDLNAFGEGAFGMYFHVVDIDQAANHLAQLGIPTQRPRPDALVIAPAHALGTTVGFLQWTGATDGH